MLSVHLKLASTDITAWDIWFDNFNWPEVYHPGYRYCSSADIEKKNLKIHHRDRPSYTVTGMDAKVFCLPVLTYSGFDDRLSDSYLLLNRVRTEDGEERYKRFGLIVLNRKAHEEFPFEDWPVTRFTFV